MIRELFHAIGNCNQICFWSVSLSLLPFTKQYRMLRDEAHWQELESTWWHCWHFPDISLDVNAHYCHPLKFPCVAVQTYKNSTTKDVEDSLNSTKVIASTPPLLLFPVIVHLLLGLKVICTLCVAYKTSLVVLFLTTCCALLHDCSSATSVL